MIFDSMFSSIPSLNDRDYARMFNYVEKKKLDQEFDYMVNILRNLPH